MNYLINLGFSFYSEGINVVNIYKYNGTYTDLIVEELYVLNGFV